MKEQSRKYDLTEAENIVIGRVASNMRAAGLLMMVYGGGFLLMGILTIVIEGGEAWDSVLQGGLFFPIGWWTRKTGSSFALVTTKKATDLGNLWTALAKLHSLYRLQKWLMALGIVLWIGIFVGTFFLIFLLPKIEHYYSQ